MYFPDYEVAVETLHTGFACILNGILFQRTSVYGGNTSESLASSYCTERATLQEVLTFPFHHRRLAECYTRDTDNTYNTFKVILQLHTLLQIL